MVGGLTREQYSAPPPGSPFSASIGQHVRHSLDHICALMAGRTQGTVCYDRRRRGTKIESDPEECIRLLNILAERLRKLPVSALREGVEVEQVLNRDGDMVLVPSTIGRELVFVFHHTIHHDAMISAQMKFWNLKPADGFGVAPATLAAEVLPEPRETGCLPEESQVSAGEPARS
jgi:hypothetical protein